MADEKKTGLIPTLGAIGSAASGIGSLLGGVGSISSLFGRRKPNAPAAPTGAQLGKEARDYYANAFPGTTVWEQLGNSNPAGQVAAATTSQQTDASIANQTQRNMLKIQSVDQFLKLAELQLARENAIKSNLTQIATSTAGLTPEAKKDALEIYNDGVLGGKPSPERTPEADASIQQKRYGSLSLLFRSSADDVVKNAIKIFTPGTGNPFGFIRDAVISENQKRYIKNYPKILKDYEQNKDDETNKSLKKRYPYLHPKFRGGQLVE